jgi:hypothetical protein
VNHGKTGIVDVQGRLFKVTFAEVSHAYRFKT